MPVLDWPLATIPSIRLAGRFPLADRGYSTTYLGQSHALHLHDYSGRMRLAGDDAALAAGDVTISPAGQPSAYDLDVPGKHWCIHFAPSQARAGRMIPLPLHLHLGGGAAAIRERMAHIARLHARGRRDDVAAASAALALQELLLWIAGRTHAPESDAVDQAAAIIEERFDEPLTVPAIARDVGRSQNHLARRFRARFGVTIPHRLLQRRAEHARYLLESTDLPIWRVAERVGIPDPHHFNKTMRRLLSASPTAIRARVAGGAPIDPDR